MQAKLVLQLDNNLIQQADLYSKRIGKSVSEIVADFFSVLDKEVSKEFTEIAPIVRSLKGSLRNADIGEEDYINYLANKQLSF